MYNENDFLLKIQTCKILIYIYDSEFSEISEHVTLFILYTTIDVQKFNSEHIILYIVYAMQNYNDRLLQ